jgi:nicotinamidase-related amidase
MPNVESSNKPDASMMSPGSRTDGVSARSRSIRLSGRFYRTYPVGSPLGYAEEPLDLAIDRTVFLIVDVYGLGFGDEPPSPVVPPIVQKWIRENRDLVVNRIVPAKAAARRRGVPVVYLTNHLSETLTRDSELSKVSLRSDGVDLREVWKEPSDYLAHSTIIAPTDGDYLVRKQHYSGFFDTHLDSLLRSLNAYNLVTAGFESRVCLGNTVTDAMYRNYRVIAVRDAIATGEEQETAKEGWANFLAVRFIETHVGYTCTTEAWLAACADGM